ncbi:hypothetical protein [Syntrophomonas palmitatica]|uniref:hypothetical protein n=1 Tax=Syntrophomonas palmitatica TaxID=402877 RepID=UPI0006D275FA|nr:hypothetical protein [Syntrophomonas palmitatica]
MNWAGKRWVYITGAMGLALALTLVSVFIVIPKHYNQKTEPVKTDPLDKFNAIEYYPLNAGSYWDYDCSLKEAVGPNEVDNKDFKIHMQVKKLYRRPNYILADMQGDPFHLDPQNRYCLLLYSNKLYYIPPEQRTRFIKATREKEFYIECSNMEMLFEFPLFAGQRFGVLSAIREDDLYISLVSRQEHSRINIKIPSDLPVYSVTDGGVGYKLQHEFIPTIGLSAVSYKHNGTVYEYEVKLLKYYLAKPDFKAS